MTDLARRRERVARFNRNTARTPRVGADMQIVIKKDHTGVACTIADNFGHVFAETYKHANPEAAVLGAVNQFQARLREVQDLARSMNVPVVIASPPPAAREVIVGLRRLADEWLARNGVSATPSEALAIEWIAGLPCD